MTQVKNLWVSGKEIWKFLDENAPLQRDIEIILFILLGKESIECSVSLM